MRIVVLLGYTERCLLHCWLKEFIKRQNFFPPGDTQYIPAIERDQAIQNGVKSPWREFEFWFMVIKNSIIPRIPLQQAISHWPRIKQCLMEAPRKREMQTDVLSAIL